MSYSYNDLRHIMRYGSEQDLDKIHKESLDKVNKGHTGSEPAIGIDERGNFYITTLRHLHDEQQMRNDPNYGSYYGGRRSRRRRRTGRRRRRTGRRRR